MLGVLSLPLVAFATPVRAQVLVDYNAALGALPQASGWLFVDDAGAEPAPVVSGGALLPHLTNNPETRWWQRADVPFQFRPGFEMVIVLAVSSSSYNGNVGDGTQRSGFYFDAVDSTGRRLTLGIATPGLTVNTDLRLDPTNGIPLVPSGGVGFHTYRLAVVADSAILQLDGARIGATVLGPAILGSSPDNVYFGDGTGAAGSEVAIQRVRYGYDNGTAAVEPVAMAVPGGLRLEARPSRDHGGVDFALRSDRGGSARVRILDLSGRRLADLGEHVASAAGTTLHWPGTDASGRKIASGAYFALAEGSAGRASCRAIVLR